MSDDEGFVSRWSRRKRATQPPAPVDAPPPPPVPEAEAQVAPAPAGPVPITEEELAALPRIEDLAPGSDIRGFLRPGVPAALKNAALRRMWMLTPTIRDHQDVAVDYAWDWNAPAGVPGAGRIDTESAARLARAILDPRGDQAAPGTDDPAKDETAGDELAGDEMPAENTSETGAPGNDAARSVASAPTEPAAGVRRHGGAKPG